MSKRTMIEILVCDLVLIKFLLYIHVQYNNYNYILLCLVPHNLSLNFLLYYL